MKKKMTIAAGLLLVGFSAVQAAVVLEYDANDFLVLTADLGGVTWAPSVNTDTGTTDRDVTLEAGSSVVTPTSSYFTRAVNNANGAMVTLDDHSATSGGTVDFSFELWVKLADLTGVHNLFETGGKTVGSAITIRDDVLDFRWNAGNVTVGAVSNKLSVLPADFIQVVGVIDVSDSFSLYVNGVLAQTLTGVTIADWAGANGSHFGGIDPNIAKEAGPGFVQTAFDGQLSLARFYNTALTASEVSAAYTTTVSEPPPPAVLSIVIDTDTQLGEFYNFWNVYPVTVQAPFLEEGQFDSLRHTYRYAKYINCVRFLGGIDLEKDDYFRGVDEEGEAICDFTEGIAMLRGIRRCGFTPWIVLDNVPAAMSDPPTTNTYGNTEPPADFQVYSSYIRQLTETLVQEFGCEEVRRWRFRVGTEPDLNPGHWSGTMEQYLAHYDYTVAAVLSVLPDADIGPGNIVDPVKHANFNSWGTEIIEHCANGTNYATGEIGTPLNFFASSYYTDVGTPDERFGDLVNLLRTELAKYPQFAEVPVEIHEFGILSENGTWIVGDGTELGASWAAHFAEKICDLQVRRAFQWRWNANTGSDLPTPITHVWDLFEEMVGGTRLSAAASRTSEEDHVGCLATKKDGHLDLIVFRHRSVRDNDESVPAHLIIQGGATADRTWTVTQAHIIDGQHAGFIYEKNSDIQLATAAAGEDANPYVIAYEVMIENHDKYEQMSPLATLDPVPELRCDASGQIQLDLTLDGHSVVHLRLENLRDPASDPVVEMALNQGSSGAALSFDSVTGKYYSINFSTNLVVGPWGQLGTNLPGTGAEISVDDTNEWTQIYYRVEAQWP